MYDTTAQRNQQTVHCQHHSNDIKIFKTSNKFLIKKHVSAFCELTENVF